MDTADHLRDASPWTGEPSRTRRAILGKLVEELGELNAALGRCIIQGVNEVHPVTKKPNLEWLMEEIADVQNMISFVQEYSSHDREAFHKRMEAKRVHITAWLAQIRG
jgi:NTP pyrophosphatase (non-canonical NTP hydrolase)